MRLLRHGTGPATSVLRTAAKPGPPGTGDQEHSTVTGIGRSDEPPDRVDVAGQIIGELLGIKPDGPQALRAERDPLDLVQTVGRVVELGAVAQAQIHLLQPADEEVLDPGDTASLLPDR